MSLAQQQPLSSLAPADYSNNLVNGVQYSGYQHQQNPAIVPQQPVLLQQVADCPPKNPCAPKVEYKKACDPCVKTDPCGRPYSMMNGWGWLAALILWFVVFTVIFWLIFYSLKPSFVLQRDSNQVDTGKVLLSAVIAALILIIIIWIIKVVVGNRY